MSSSSPSDDASSDPPRLAPGDNTFKLQVDGVEREFLAYCPNGASEQPRAIVFVFHGGGTNATWVRRFCALTGKADDANFLVVFPSGTGARVRRLSWNCPGSGYERWKTDGDEQGGPDEATFVRAIVDTLAELTPIDRARIYVSGVSTGAILAYYLAAKMSEEIAAIAAVGGPIGEYREPPSRPVPVIHFHGTEDQFAPYNGGPGPQSFTGLNFNSVADSIETWAKFIGCELPPKVEELPQVKDRLLRVTRSLYSGKDCSEIALYTIANGGHTWPGQDPRMELMGRYSEDLIANDVMWDFFQRHPLPAQTC